MVKTLDNHIAPTDYEELNMNNIEENSQAEAYHPKTFSHIINRKSDIEPRKLTKDLILNYLLHLHGIPSCSLPSFYHPPSSYHHTKEARTLPILHPITGIESQNCA